MADTTPTPAPTDNAPELNGVAPDVTPTAPDTSNTLPAAASDASQPESPIGDYAPNGSQIRTAPAAKPSQGFRGGFAAGALPPSYHTDDQGNLVPDRAAVKPSFKGVLGGILGGALRGATEGMAAEKDESGAHAAQRLSDAADAKAREVAERNFQNKRAVQKDLLEHNLMTAQTANLIQKSKIEAEQHEQVKKGWGLQDQETRQKMEANDQAERNSIASFNAELQQHGIKPLDTITKQEPSGVSGAIPEGEQATPTSVLGQMLTHATNLSNGKVIATQNGGRGAKNGAFIWKASDLDNTINQPFYYQVATGLHNEDGTPNMEERVITPDGKTTYRQVLAEIHAGMTVTDQANKKMGADQAALKAKADLAHTEAETKQAGATAEAESAKALKDRTTAENEKIVNNPAGAGLTGDEYIKTLPPNQQPIVKAIGEGRATYSDRQLFTKDGMPTPTLQMVYRAYPDFNVQNAKTWAKTDNEYRGSGPTAKKVVNYNGALQHFKALWENTNWNGMYNPASKEYQRRNTDTIWLKNEIGNAMSQGVLSQGEGKEVMDAISGGATPELAREKILESTKRAMEKMDEYQRKYQEGAPSSAVKVRTLISAPAEEAKDWILAGGKAPAPEPPDPNHVVASGKYQGKQIFKLDTGHVVDEQGNRVYLPR